MKHNMDAPEQACLFCCCCCCCPTLPVTAWDCNANQSSAAGEETKTSSETPTVLKISGALSFNMCRQYHVPVSIQEKLADYRLTAQGCQVVKKMLFVLTEKTSHVMLKFIQDGL